MKKITIEVPKGFDVVKTEAGHKLVAKKKAWPQKGDLCEWISADGSVIIYQYENDEHNERLKESGNFFKLGQAEKSVLYEILNGEYYLVAWVARPVKSPRKFRMFIKRQALVSR